jgi:hypothetical protein
LFRDLPGHIGGLEIRREHRIRAGFAVAQPGRDSDRRNTIKAVIAARLRHVWVIAAGGGQDKRLRAI